MKIIIFAGGTGTRFWPLSRKKFPKQFKKMFQDKKGQKASTLQMMVERVERTFGTDNIYISTNEKYVSIVKEQLPQVPTTNIFAEPEKKDVGPAVGYSFMRLRKLGYKGPVAILWADHLIENVPEFIFALKKGKELVYENPNTLVFVSEEPRYAENNFGWIHIGKEITKNVHEFAGWKYRPDVDKCKEMFESGQWKWNSGYFIVDMDFTLSLFKKHQPEMYNIFEKIEKSIGTVNETKVIKKNYALIKPLSFDNAIAEKVPLSDAVVVTANMGWADPGTLYALKESLVSQKEDNYQKGTVFSLDTKDSVLINEEENKILTAVGLEGMVVVNLEDAIIVVHKDNVREVTDLVSKLSEEKKFSKFV